MPKAAISACSKRSRESSSNSSSSFGLELGKPASITSIPSSSSRCATRSFSRADNDMPSPCMPSRSVVSYSSIRVIAFVQPVAAVRDGTSTTSSHSR